MIDTEYTWSLTLPTAVETLLGLAPQSGAGQSSPTARFGVRLISGGSVLGWYVGECDSVGLGKMPDRNEVTR